MKRALLVVDMQEDFFKEASSAYKSLSQSVGYINAAISVFREKDFPVIVVEHVDEDNAFVPGSKGFDTHPDIKLKDSDLRIRKTAGNAFHGTDLSAKLMEMGVESVVICGYCAEYCILSTIRGAEDNGFKPMIFRGSLASSSPENIPFVEKINDIISYGALRTL